MCARVAAVLALILIASSPATPDADACGVKLSFKVANRAKAKPIAKSGDRTAIAKKANEKTPIAAGPAVRDATATKIIAAKPTTEPPKETAGTPPAPVTVAKAEPKKVETPKPTPAPKPEPKKVEQPKPDPVEPPVAKVDPTPKPEPVKPTPAPKPVAVVKTPNMLGEIHFAFDASGVGDNAKGTISRVAKWLVAHPDVRVNLEGHADPIGPANVNEAISKQRAESVKQQLVDAGVDGSRIDTAGFGFARLKYGAADARNRRVEILPVK